MVGLSEVTHDSSTVKTKRLRAKAASKGALQSSAWPGPSPCRAAAFYPSHRPWQSKQVVKNLSRRQGLGPRATKQPWIQLLASPSSPHVALGESQQLLGPQCLLYKTEQIKEPTSSKAETLERDPICWHVTSAQSTAPRIFHQFGLLIRCSLPFSFLLRNNH